VAETEEGDGSHKASQGAADLYGRGVLIGCGVFANGGRAEGESMQWFPAIAWNDGRQNAKRS